MAIDNQETADKPNNIQITGGDNQWLKPLLEEKFFTSCLVHANWGNNNKCNNFCTKCLNGAFCPRCLPHHKDHKVSVIQIRKLKQENVIRVDKIEKVMDITGVQVYTARRASVVKLKQLPEKRPRRASSHTCQVCPRSLTASYHFCSLACKSVEILKELEKKRKRDVQAMSIEPESSRRDKRRKGIPRRASEAGPSVEYSHH